MSAPFVSKKYESTNSVERLRRNLPDLIFLGLMIAAFVFVGTRILGTSTTSGWQTDFDNISIDMDEVLSGGVPRDGIPPIDNPMFDRVADVNHLSAQSPVISVNLNGDARAYPLEVLTRHEIVNDTVGGVPVAVTFCPLCNSAIVYERTVDGEVLRFGVSGNLRHSDLIMWDDKTESWWQQLTGQGIVGDYNGYQLTFVPSQMIGFGVFAERYPDGQVLRGPLGGYGINPYVGYDSSPNPFLYRGKMDDRLFPTARVIAIKLEETPIAYPFHDLQSQHVINDTRNEINLVIFWQAGATSALDQRDIDASKDVGMALMYDRTLSTGETLTFRYDDGQFRDSETNSLWTIWGEAIDGQLKGTQLHQLNAYPHFWFAWTAFHPDTLLYTS